MNLYIYKILNKIQTLKSIYNSIYIYIYIYIYILNILIDETNL